MRILLISLLTACGNTLECGQGTHEEDEVCVADAKVLYTDGLESEAQQVECFAGDQ